MMIFLKSLRVFFFFFFFFFLLLFFFESYLFLCCSSNHPPSKTEETEQQVPSSSSAPTPKSSSSSSPVAPSKTPSEPTLGAGDVSATLKETKSLSSLHLERNSVLIQVVGCKELKNVDIIGKSDPWVKIKVLDRSGVKQRSFKTKRIDNNLNPVWDQDFMFVFRFGTTIDDYLVQFEVYDHDRTTDTFLGICIQPMANIMGKRPGRIMECKLEPKKSGQNVKGTIQFSVRYPSPQEVQFFFFSFEIWL